MFSKGVSTNMLENAFFELVGSNSGGLDAPNGPMGSKLGPAGYWVEFRAILGGYSRRKTLPISDNFTQNFQSGGPGVKKRGSGMGVRRKYPKISILGTSGCAKIMISHRSVCKNQHCAILILGLCFGGHFGTVLGPQIPTILTLGSQRAQK